MKWTSWDLSLLSLDYSQLMLFQLLDVAVVEAGAEIDKKKQAEWCKEGEFLMYAVEKYKVKHANTERFKKSSIIAMQKMLNHDTRT